MISRPPRVMWLLNHSTARKFEVPQLIRNGFTEIFAPKRLVQNTIFRSANVDWSLDQTLTIPEEDLERLNAVDWYDKIDLSIWPIVNRHFDLMFFIFMKPDQFLSFTDNFRGAMIWRVYGREYEQSYSSILGHYFNGKEGPILKTLSKRFWLGEAYDHLHEIEHEPLKRQSLFLPLGLQDCSLQHAWTGTDARILFVCPDIGVAEYYKTIYRNFKTQFGDLPHAIGGSQPRAVPDPAVLGYLPLEAHERNMREMRAMFYHSQEPNHIHYHPFEAVRAGMPLIFMSDGMLDRFGGIGLQGRCTSIAQAHRKLKRILNNDRSFIDAIISSQQILLEPMKVENCEEAWTSGLQKVRDQLERFHVDERPALPSQKKRKKIAVILPLGYLGGSLRGAMLTANAIKAGSKLAGEEADVVFGHLVDPAIYDAHSFKDLYPEISVRPFYWRSVDEDEANRIMALVGVSLMTNEGRYIVPDDGINFFADCDAWVMISDRLQFQLLPIRPYVMVVYDYSQRYHRSMQISDESFIKAARTSKSVLVTTRQTYLDAIQYANLGSGHVLQVPMLVPRIALADDKFAPKDSAKETDPYFLWSTNLALHKNHTNAFGALEIYYLQYGGTLKCVVTGTGTEQITIATDQHLQKAKTILRSNPAVRRMVKLTGYLSSGPYMRTLAKAVFLWHPASFDNGTFSVVEAAQWGVPSLSSDYPAMREINDEYAIGLQWMDSREPENMARMLKHMELQFEGESLKKPDAQKVIARVENPENGKHYWEAIKQCL